VLNQEHLENFLLVVELGSLSRAARRAHLTQPALSRQMKLLEDEVGCQLFERTGRGMLPTLQGRRLEARARPLLAQLSGLRDEFRDAPLAGPLTFGVTPSVGMTWTAGLVSRFCKRYPQVELRVAVALSGASGEALESGKFDLGVLYSPAGGAQLVKTELWREEVRFLCQKQHPLASKKSISLKQALSASLILPSSQLGIRALLEEHARTLGMRVESAFRIDSVQLAMELVRQGHGQLLLTERALFDVQSKNLVAVAIRRPNLMRAAELAATEAALRRPVVRAFWEFVLEQQRASAPE